LLSFVVQYRWYIDEYRLKSSSMRVKIRCEFKHVATTAGGRPNPDARGPSLYTTSMGI
jgi:hypothetical protein